jgi:hypothetical protein
LKSDGKKKHYLYNEVVRVDIATFQSVLKTDEVRGPQNETPNRNPQGRAEVYYKLMLAPRCSLAVGS